MSLRPLLAGVLLLAGCLTHVPPKASLCHMQVHWASDYAAAQARAEAEGKPILACLVAGKIDGFC